jgi:serine/threonine protein kinase
VTTHFEDEALSVLSPLVKGSQWRSSTAAAKSEDPAEQRMIGRYAIMEVGKIVSSGKSHLVDGRHEVTGDVVKIKVTKDFGDFQREKHALKSIKSQNVVKLVDCLEDFDGRGSHAIIMEAGKDNMAESVKATKQTGADDMNKKAMDAKDAVLALQAIHDKSLVWTDLKSENFVSHFHP